MSAQEVGTTHHSSAVEHAAVRTSVGIIDKSDCGVLVAGAVPEARAWSHVPGTVSGADVRLVRGSGETGEAEIWVVAAAANRDGVAASFTAAGAKPVGRATFDALRIEAGTPAFPD